MNTVVETQLEFDFMKPTQADLKFDTDLYIRNNSSSKLIAFCPTYKVIFHNADGEVGVLDWSDGTMKFRGDADAAGQLFFDHIIKQHVQMAFQFESQKSGWKS
jgi:hypothetical protein